MYMKTVSQSNLLKLLNHAILVRNFLWQPSIFFKQEKKSYFFIPNPLPFPPRFLGISS